MHKFEISHRKYAKQTGYRVAVTLGGKEKLYLGRILKKNDGWHVELSWGDDDDLCFRRLEDAKLMFSVAVLSALGDRIEGAHP